MPAIDRTLSLSGCRYEAALNGTVPYEPYSGVALRGVRAAMGLSRSALAKSIGVNVKDTQLKEWEDGKGEGGRGVTKSTGDDGAAAPAALIPFR